MKHKLLAVVAVLIISNIVFATETKVATNDKKTTITGNVLSVSAALYNKLSLRNMGLNINAFKYAITGYMKLLNRGIISNKQYLTIVDFSQSSRKKRFYIIDVKRQKLVMNTYVAHGKNSGADVARKFSNRPESEQSSLGFYLTKNTYFGKHGLALKLSGLERGINDNVERRAIVVHGSYYVNRERANTDRMGRSQGCPALPASQSAKAISYMKGGSAMFVYHPDKNYLNKSVYVN
jgi:hypothetical protein